MGKNRESTSLGLPRFRSPKSVVRCFKALNELMHVWEPQGVAVLPWKNFWRKKPPKPLRIHWIPVYWAGGFFALGCFFAMQKSRRSFWRDLANRNSFLFFWVGVSSHDPCQRMWTQLLPILGITFFSRNMSILDRLTGFSNVRKKKPTNMDPPNSPRREIWEA